MIQNRKTPLGRLFSAARKVLSSFSLMQRICRGGVFTWRNFDLSITTRETPTNEKITVLKRTLCEIRRVGQAPDEDKLWGGMRNFF